MSDAVSNQLWALSLSGLPPKSTLNTLKARLSRSEAFNTTLSELFKARAAAELEYSSALQKIGKKFGDGGTGVAGEKGENTVKMWEMLLSDLNDTASQHSQFANIIKSEYETPVREMPIKIGSWSRIGVQDSNVDKTVKAWESAQQKVEKAKKKGGPKLTVAQSELSSATSDLQIQSPSLYASYQQVDKERLEKLKEIALKYQTWKSDRGQRMLQGAERGTITVLSWEVDDDLRGVVRKLGGRMGAEEDSAGWAGDSDAASQRGTPSRPSNASRQTSTSNDFQPSYQDTPTSGAQRNGSVDATPNLPPPSSSLTSAFKSKFSRKNSVAGGRDRSLSNATLKSNANGRPGMVNQSSGAFETLNETRQGGSSEGAYALPKPAAGGSLLGDAPSVDADGFSVPPPNSSRAPWEGSGSRDLMDEDNEDDSISALPSPSLQSSAPPRLNMSLAPTPIQESEADQAAALQKVQASLLAAPPAGANAVNRRSTMGQRGRRDVRNTMFAGAPDDMPLAQAMKMYGQEDGMRTESPTSLTSPILPMPAAPGANGSDSRPGTVNRQMSTMSSASSNNPFDSHPAVVLGAGLRASITESVNATSKDGLITKALVTGEINVSLRDLSKFAPPGSSGTIHIRLEQFEQLEKVAPNPKFLSQVPNTPGEYFLNTEVLASATSSQATPPILFKYQVYIPEEKFSTFAPVEFNPQWRHIPGETRLLLPYSVNKSSVLYLAANHAETSPFGESGPGRLTDVTFIAGLGGATVKNVQAKPVGGKWSGERKKMMWKVDDLELASAEPAAGKIVARFLTEGEEEGSPEGVSVKFRYEGVLGSGLGLAVVADGTSNEGWKFEEVKKVVVSGTYATE